MSDKMIQNLMIDTSKYPGLAVARLCGVDTSGYGPRLYHGTSLENWKDFLRYGIEPRGSTPGVFGSNSNGENVYLTSFLAPMYALHTSPPGEALFLIEIDFNALDQRRLLPDDDYIASLRNEAAGLSVAEGRARYRAMDFEERQQEAQAIHREAIEKAHLWPDSLRECGTVAYRGAVPPEAFTRHVFCTSAVLYESEFFSNDGDGEMDGQAHARLTQWVFETPCTDDQRIVSESPSQVRGIRIMDAQNGGKPPRQKRSGFLADGYPETAYSGLWRKASANFALNHCHSLHGLWHWRRVEKNGRELAAATGADAVVVHLFAAVHDVARWDEGQDPEHGRRAAELCKAWRDDGYFHNADEEPVSDDQFAALLEAVAGHADGMTSDDPTIGTCWDSDRLDLPRVGIAPDPAMLSTLAARQLIAQDVAKRLTP